uniref:TOG domain-containing protein n=1 Tax=Macrostomum lignano TaxID=282301 RepID=A0A1I8I5Z4_9PLAT
ASSRGSSPPRSGIPVPMNSSTPAPAGSSSLRRSSQGAGGGGGGSISARSSFRGGRQRVEQQAAAQSALAEALQFKLQQRRQTGDGDDASETSSVCSDASFKSFTNLAEILAQLQSSEWSCRRDGLASFSSYLAREGGPSLNQLELRRVCDIFAKMFGEPNGRVMQFFLEALADFVTRYHGELHDWLYTLLVRLVGRMATETLASQQARFQTAMERVQRAFPITLQLRCLLRFLIDQNQQPSPRVQAALLQCLLQVVRQLPADALVPWRNQSDQPGQEARIALSRLTTLTKDPKSPDVRRLSQAVLAALFDLNPGCFSAVLKEMQPTIQQRATDKQQQVSGPRSSAAATPAPLSARGGVTRPAAAVVRRAAPATSAAAAPAAAAAANAAANAGDGSDDLLNSIHMAALNLQHEQRMSSMQRLVRMVRDNSVDSWDENFKTVLLILLETLGDNEADIRALALTVLQELIRAQPRRLSNYTELTLLKILEAHRDTDKLVAKAAEDCAKHVAAHLPGDVCLRVLTPLVSGADPGLALAAVKMQMRVVQECEPRAVEAALPELCPGLVRCCDHAESQIRKAAIFCLVQMYMKVGETLLLHLKDMSSTKRRLLQLYICKARVGTAQDGGGGGGGAGGVALPPVS